jgi:predicted ArsR family transcriptional regulator
MASRYEERIYGMLSEEPVTPSEVANKIGVTHKTAQRVLMQLALTKQDVRYKNSGRIHLFWRVTK